MITVEHHDAQTWQVALEGPPVTRHEVIIAPEVHQRLTGGSVSAEQLLERSFQFLLAREPNTSIMARFELSVIERYFPEYTEEIQAWAKAQG